MARLAATLAFALTGCAYFTPQETPARDGGSAPLHGCASGAFVNARAATASRVVTFGPTFQFTPKCLTVAAGQTVSFMGFFTGHPLSPGVQGGADAGASPNNPIPRTATGMQVDVVFPTAGVFPYFCEMHGAAGMVGIVRVE